MCYNSPVEKIWRHGQVVRQRSATPLSPVRIWVAPPKKDRHPFGCLSFFVPYSLIGLGFCALTHKNQFAFLTKQRLPLASNLVGKNSALSSLCERGFSLRKTCSKKLKHHFCDVLDYGWLETVCCIATNIQVC